ncbi:32749_t:CDS:1, partial [Gigaspora margarita]
SNEYIKLFEYGSFANWKKIDEGGFGAVFSAYSKNTEEIITLKRLHNSPTSVQKFAGE